jgi:hypothetical protein
MRTVVPTSLTFIAAALFLSACNQAVDKPDAAAVEAPQPVWPASLSVVGEGFPNPGDACRKIGESAATINYLDDSATLAGCLSLDDAEKLGGKILVTIDGVTLVSVPAGDSMAGDGDGQGDAKVAGTDFNATAQIKCSGYRKHPAGMCDAGVKRGTGEELTTVEISWPEGDSRALFFDATGKIVSANTNQADGSAQFEVVGNKQGDTTIVTIGPERYEIPDVFLMGD